MLKKILTSWPQFRLSHLALIASIIFNIILWALALTLFPTGDAVTVLHYSVGLGIDLIGEGRQIIMLPVIGLAILIGNTALAASLRRSEPITATLLVAAVPITQLILLGSFILILQANL